LADEFADYRIGGVAKESFTFICKREFLLAWRVIIAGFAAFILSIHGSKIEERIEGRLLLFLFLDSLFEIRDALLDLIDNQLSGWFERRRQARIGNDLFAVIDENPRTCKKRRKKTDNYIYTYYY